MEVAKELLRISHADQVLDQAVSLILPQQIKSIKSLRPDIPEKALNRFGEVFKASFRKNMQEFLDAAALTYTRHLSEADMKAIIRVLQDAGRPESHQETTCDDELSWRDLDLSWVRR